MRERYDLEESDIVEREIKDITMDGAFRLATAILLDTYNEYEKALKTIMCLRKYVEKTQPIIREYDKWEILKSEVAVIKGLIRNRKGKVIHQHELDKITKFGNMAKPKKPSANQIMKCEEYYNALKEKVMCEQFYKSKRYSILTLGKGVPGEELIIKIQKEVGYK